MTESKISSIQGENQPLKRVTFNYIKSNFFRVIHVDGVSGGVTPSSDLFINFYSERRSIPKKLVYELDSEGSLKREVVEERDDLNSVIREVDVSAVMTIETAKQLVESLQLMIEAVEEDEQEEEDND
ncbi:MAG TPA: hypothetical protein V6D26_21790 [Stenomitos sp.]